MIAFLNGRLDYVDDSYAYIECAGVGYRVMMSAIDIASLGDPNDNVKVYTYLSVKENEMSLYGFLSMRGRRLFEMLISVNGLGPKYAIAILSALTVDETYTALVSGDAKALSSAKGVGKKIAERAILELGSKIDSDILADITSTHTAATDISYKTEIIMALEALGYSRLEANEAIRSVSYIDGMSEEDFLKECLKAMI